MKLTRELREVGTGMENVNEPEMVNNEFYFFMCLLKLARGGENQRMVFEKKLTRTDIFISDVKWLRIKRDGCLFLTTHLPILECSIKPRCSNWFSQHSSDWVWMLILFWGTDQLNVYRSWISDWQGFLMLGSANDSSVLGSWTNQRADRGDNNKCHWWQWILSGCDPVIHDSAYPSQCYDLSWGE